MSKTNYWNEIEDAFDTVDIYETYELFQEEALKYPEWKIDLLAVHWTMSEVVNGGLEQYFCNSTGILAPEAVLGLRRIGLPELADALQKAVILFGEPYPRERQVRIERMKALSGTHGEGKETEGFSIIPKWVAKKVGMKLSPTPLEEMSEVLEGAGDTVEEAMDRYAVAKAG